jgi:hypothetical protein
MNLLFLIALLCAAAALVAPKIFALIGWRK